MIPLHNLSIFRKILTQNMFNFYFFFDCLTQEDEGTTILQNVRNDPPNNEGTTILQNVRTNQPNNEAHHSKSPDPPPRGWDSSDGIATGYGLDGPGIKSQ
jgi:hypothetical protein